MYIIQKYISICLFWMLRNLFIWYYYYYAIIIITLC